MMDMMILYTKTSKGAYQMMADLVRLSDEIGRFIVNLSDLKGSTSPLRQRRVSKTISYLKSAGYLQPVGRTRCKLTDFGKISVLNELVRRRKPDGRLRIVIFDIPEENKRSRDFFRQHLTNLGFTMEQKSVWYSKTPCEDLVELVINYHGLNKYASLVVGKLVRY